MRKKKFLMAAASVMCAALVMCSCNNKDASVRDVLKAHKGHDVNALFCKNDTGVFMGALPKIDKHPHGRLDYTVSCVTCNKGYVKFRNEPIAVYDKCISTKNKNGNKMFILCKSDIERHETVFETLEYATECVTLYRGGRIDINNRTYFIDTDRMKQWHESVK